LNSQLKLVGENSALKSIARVSTKGRDPFGSRTDQFSSRPGGNAPEKHKKGNFLVKKVKYCVYKHDGNVEYIPLKEK
jgi:hypothetical protein